MCMKVLDTSNVARKIINYNSVDIDSIPENCRKGSTDKEIIDNFIKEYGVLALTFKKRGDY